ncbi:MAG: type I-B CRISPR-associated protein Cas5b [Candidatus Jettenia sp.]|nr:type I-B CRISPR-associated protein Cas5b [Candidatus Jettenia sp.]
MIKKLLHIHIKGWTATFRLPLLYSGTGLTSPVPPYSTLIGMIGCIAAKDFSPNDIGKLGYVFKSDSKAVDLETTKRLSMNEKGELGPNIRKGDGIAKREFHIKPDLHLYLENLLLRSFFENPQNIPTLGRSQDLCWIESIKEVSCELKEEGSVRGTLVPFPTHGASGLILLLPDWFDNVKNGYTRSIVKLRRYQAVKYNSPTGKIKLKNLFAVDGQDSHVYLHDFN